MKTKKIDKEFLITDSTVNCYGFRLLTEGYLIDEYKKNPIGYYMHDRDGGVVVRWEDLRKEGDKVFGKPLINLSNARGQQCADEVEAGFLNGASVGHIVALEFSEDPAMMIAGQTGPTVTKWYNRETSLVDVPGNMNALALYDKDGNVLNLADFKNKTIFQMEKIFLTPEQLSKLGLKADAKNEAVETAINDLIAKASKVDDLQNKLTASETAKTNWETEVSNLKAEATKKKVEDLIANGKADKKLTNEAATKLAEQFKTDPEGLKAVIDLMQPHVSVVDTINNANNKKESKDLVDKTWAELDAIEGALEKLKATDKNAFFDKFKEHYGKPHNEDKRGEA